VRAGFELIERQPLEVGDVDRVRDGARLLRPTGPPVAEFLVLTWALAV
jgi:hypothetical protein